MGYNYLLWAHFLISSRSSCRWASCFSLSRSPYNYNYIQYPWHVSKQHEITNLFSLHLFHSLKLFIFSSPLLLLAFLSLLLKHKDEILATNKLWWIKITLCLTASNLVAIFCCSSCRLLSSLSSSCLSLTPPNNIHTCSRNRECIVQCQQFIVNVFTAVI